MPTLNAMIHEYEQSISEDIHIDAGAKKPKAKKAKADSAAAQMETFIDGALETSDIWSRAQLAKARAEPLRRMRFQMINLNWLR